MPPYSQSAVGKEAVRKAYDAVFAELKFDVKFTIAELVVMAPRLGLCADEFGRRDRPCFDRQDHCRSQSGALHFREGRGRRMAHRALQLLADAIRPAPEQKAACGAVG